MIPIMRHNTFAFGSAATACSPSNRSVPHCPIIVVSVIALLIASAAGTQPRGTSVSLLVSTDWLAERLHDPGVVIVWTGQANRDEPLIAGARPITHDSLMTMGAGRHDVAATDDLVTALEAAGVSNSSHVVVYGEPLAAGWLFFTLEYLGHDRVSMLDGGIAKWRAEGRPVVRAQSPVIRGTFRPTLRPWLRATTADVQAQTERGAVLLDARSAKEFEAGRIPGAHLLTWQDVYDDPKLQIFKNPAELVRLLGTAGATVGRPAITYCQIGLRSSVLYFAARYAGLDVSNYVGSWSEWSARGLPSESSAER
jgi:thiosulfate/3-mercaptopyruvate sulfurtransferase